MRIGGWEIALIVVAIILIFGVGKLGQLGGALGKSIREFRREKDRKDDDVPQSTTKESGTAKSIAQSEVKPKEETKS